MKKAIISLFVIVAFAIYSVHTRNEQKSPIISAASTSLQTTTSGATSSSNDSSATATMSSASMQNNTTQYKDGSYTGKAADAYYGNIQVKVTISGGKLTDVAFLQYPSDQRESVQINAQAMPLLKQEAIKAQTAQIDGVSGATDTAQAFIESLGSALSQAKV